MFGLKLAFLASIAISSSAHGQSKPILGVSNIEAIPTGHCYRTVSAPNATKSADGSIVAEAHSTMDICVNPRTGYVSRFLLHGLTGNSSKSQEARFHFSVGGNYGKCKKNLLEKGIFESTSSKTYEGNFDIEYLRAGSGIEEKGVVKFEEEGMACFVVVPN